MGMTHSQGFTGLHKKRRFWEKMKRLTSILAISVIAVMSAGAARADIASTTFVDKQVAPVSAKADTNAGEIATLKSGKQDKLGYTAENAANKVVSGGDMEKALKEADADTKYPTLKAALEVAQIAAGAATATYGELANHDTVSTNLIDNGAVTTEKIAAGTIVSDKVMNGAITSDKIRDGAIEEVNLSDAVKTKLNATVQKIDSAAAADGKYVTNLTKDGTTVKLETAYVQIPVGSVTAPTSMASIWVE